MKTAPQKAAQKPRKIMIGIIGLALVGGIVAPAINNYLENGGNVHWVNFLALLPKSGVTKVEETASIQKYRDHLRSIDPTGSLIANVELGVSARIVNISVTNVWFSQPKEVRLQTAQNLWKIWASIASPSDLDKAYIKIVDANGNTLGGSGFAGSMVNVN